MPSKRARQAILALQLIGPKRPMAVRWSGDGPVIHVQITDVAITRTVELEEGLIADYDAAGDLVAFEVVSPPRADFQFQVPMKLGKPSAQRKTETWELVGAA